MKRILVGLTGTRTLLAGVCCRRAYKTNPSALTFIQSTPVTTITVGGRAVQAIVDISGGDADGALTLSKETIESADGISLGLRCK